MALTHFRQKIIEELMAAEGGKCHYCRTAVRLNVMRLNKFSTDATIDHKIPRSKGGTNARENLFLACRRCNEAKGDRSVEDFLADPRSERERKQEARKKIEAKIARRRTRATSEKIMRGTLAAAIQRGDILENGMYARRKPMDVPRRIPEPRMTALETARWLREKAEKKGKPWPLA